MVHHQEKVGSPRSNLIRIRESLQGPSRTEFGRVEDPPGLAEGPDRKEEVRPLKVVPGKVQTELRRDLLGHVGLQLGSVLKGKR